MIAPFPVIPDSKAIAHEWKDFQSMYFCYLGMFRATFCYSADEISVITSARAVVAVQTVLMAY